jgi:DUF971 family protein
LTPGDVDHRVINPRKIEFVNSRLHIRWEDNSEVDIPAGNLRRWCPCAGCSQQRQEEPEHFIPILSREQTIPVSIEPVGKYAVRIRWKDGHDLGIYEFAFLQTLSALKSGIVV